MSPSHRRATALHLAEFVKDFFMLTGKFLIVLIFLNFFTVLTHFMLIFGVFFLLIYKLNIFITKIVTVQDNLLLEGPVPL